MKSKIKFIIRGWWGGLKIKPSRYDIKIALLAKGGTVAIFQRD